MKKNKKLIFAVFLLVSVVLLVFYFVSMKNKETTAPQNIPTTAPSPTPFKLLYFTPSEENQEIVIDNLALEFIFSKPIDTSSASVEITPFLDFSLSFNEKEDSLYIFPTQNWVYGENYTIKISVKSSSGEALPNEIVYQFNPKRPTNSDLDESILNY